MNAEAICRLAPVILVLTIEEAAHAVPLARALARGGLSAIEITLARPSPPRHPDADRGGPRHDRRRGDVIDTRGLHAAEPPAPGSMSAPSDRLLDAAEDAGLPMLPGVATPGEARHALERGLDVLKFFPADPNGGPSALAA